MSNWYIVGIDESGSFDKPNSRIGGVVFKNTSRKQIKDYLQTIWQSWNSQHPDSQIQEFVQLHYFPLRKKVCRHSKMEKNIALSEKEGKQFTNMVVEKIKKTSEFSFHSSGFPPFFANEQQAYVDILRTTIWGLLTEKLTLAKDDKVYLRIASRCRAQGRFGLWEPTDYNLYHEYLMQQLQKKFSFFAKQQSIELYFETEQASVTPELTAADFILGNQKTKAVQLAYHKISFNDYYYRIIGKDPVVEIIDAHEKGDCTTVQAYLRLLHLYALEKQKQRSDAVTGILTQSKKLMREIIPNANLLEEVITAIDKTLNTLMDKRVYDSQNLILAENYCQALTQSCQDLKLHQENHILLLRLQEVLLRNKIAVESHKGAIADKSDEYIQNYRSFFAKHKQALYPTIGERVKHLLEMELKAVQLNHFNCYNFSTVDSLLSIHYQNYKQMYQQSLANGEKDDIFARLCGTLGQAHAFMYAITANEDYYEMAALELLEDTDNLVPHSVYWGQGMQYRIHLELCHSNLDEAMELMRTLWDKTLTYDSLFAWASTHGEPWDVFLCLKSLGYCKSTPDISALEIEKLLDKMQKNNWHSYPSCNSLKWISYHSLCINEPELAEKALALISPFSKEFTYQTLELPILMLKTYLKSKSPKPILEKLQSLMSAQPQFRECMEQMRWKEKFPADSTKTWNLWDIVTLLPFYYC